MSVGPNSRTEGLINRGVGTILALIGLALIGLGIILVLPHETYSLSYLQGGLFAIIFGAMLTWVGWRFFVRETDAHWYSDIRSGSYGLLLRGRRLVALLAAGSGILMFGHALAILIGRQWPPQLLLWSLLRAPVIFGPITFMVLAPDVLEEGLFARETWSRWSPTTRRLLRLTVRVGWMGYIPALWVIFRLPGVMPKNLEPGGHVIASMAISILYASQALLLCYGRLRESSLGPGGPTR
jgi:hypothetical protein